MVGNARAGGQQSAVVCGESSLGYTCQHGLRNLPSPRCNQREWIIMSGDIQYYGGWIGPTMAMYELDLARREGNVVTMQEAKERGILTIPPMAGSVGSKPVWELDKMVIGRQWLPGKQEIGDCVSWGMKHAGEVRNIFEIANGQEEKWRPWFAPWIYAISRNQIGGGRIAGDGSLGIWAAKGVAEYGVLFEDDEGVPKYSGSIARQWGSPRNAGDNPVYKDFFDVAHDNKCYYVETKTVQELVEMIKVYRRPVTIASMRGFYMKPREYKGYHVFTPSGQWAHQMCWIEYNEELPALYRMNSWGPEAHGKPLRGETPGGAWNLLDDIDYELRAFDVEAFALVEFEGEPGKPDWNPI